MKIGELVLVKVVYNCVLSGSRGNEGNDGVEEVDHCRDQDEGEPEPNEEINFLVEHVDHQDTLDSVVVEIGQSSDLEVTESHSGEDVGVHPVLALDKLEHGVQSPETVGSSQEAVQNDELNEDVQDVEELDEDVQTRNIGSQMTTDPEEQNPSRDSSRLVDLQSLGYVRSELLDFCFSVRGLHCPEFGCIGDGRPQVHSTLLMQCLPDPVGNVKHNCLKCQHYWDPLVVAELLFLSLVVIYGNFVEQRNIISILNKTIIFYVLFPASLELGRHPTLDWRPYVSKKYA